MKTSLLYPTSKLQEKTCQKLFVGLVFLRFSHSSRVAIQVKLLTSDTAGVSCEEGDLYAIEVGQSVDGETPCLYQAEVTDAEYGTAEIMTVTAPQEYSIPDPYNPPNSFDFSVQIGTQILCMEPGEKNFSAWTGTSVANSYTADYSTDTTCSNICYLEIMNEDFVTTKLEICNVNGDLPGADAASGNAGAPPPAVEDPRKGSRTGKSFSGIYWYQILNRSGGYTC